MISPQIVLTLSLCFGTSWAIPWIATSYVEVVKTTLSPATTIGTFVDPAFVETATIAVTPTVTPAPAPTRIWVTTDDYESFLTNVFEVLPSSAVATIGYGDYDYSYDTEYYVPLVYKAPADCATPWTYTTRGIAYVPAGVHPSASFISYDTAISVSEFLISPTLVPTAAISSLKSLYLPPWATGCTIPDYATETYSSSYPTGYDYGSGGGDDSWDGCSPFQLMFGDTTIGGGYICGDDVEYTYGLSLAGIICLLVFSWLALFLICGLIENWYTFRSLSLGKSARRGLPICFALLFPILSCFCLLGSRSGYEAKTNEEQQGLRHRWNALPAHSKIGQWLSWGFRFQYPPFLGPEPPRKGQMVQRGPQPQMINAPGGYYVYQPHPAGSDSRGMDGSLSPPPYAPSHSTTPISPIVSSQPSVSPVPPSSASLVTNPPAPPPGPPPAHHELA